MLQEQAEQPTNVTFKDNLLDTISFFEKKQNFIYFLCYSIIKDIKNHASSSKISKKFTNTYFSCRARITCDCSNCNHHKEPPYLELNDDIKKELKKYFNTNDLVFFGSIIKEKFDTAIDEIKRVNTFLELINNIVSYLNNSNNKKDKTKKSSYMILYDIGLDYINELNDTFESDFQAFMQKIEIEKASYCDTYKKFESNAREIFLKYFGNIKGIVEKYEQKIFNIQFDKCIQEMETLHNYWYSCDIQRCFEQFFTFPLEISIFSKSEQIEYIKKEINAHCKIYSGSNVQEDKNSGHNYQYNNYKEVFITAFNSLNKNIDNLNQKLSHLTQKNRSCNFISKRFNNLFHRQNADEPIEKTFYENSDFNNNLITLFKLNMRGLICLKIVVNAIEYFEIYHYSYVNIKKMKPFDKLKKEDIPKDNEQMNELKNKIKEDLNDEEKLLLYKYFLYQNYKKSCFTSNIAFFKYLFEITNYFGKIEDKILQFCGEYLCENKELGYETLKLIYEEEYLKFADEVDKGLTYSFLSLPIKLKKLVN